MPQKKREKPRRWIACPVEEEYFGAADRKAKRKESKIASSTDRSKYKKTDSKKQHLKKNPPTGLRGRVLSITSRGIVVDSNGATRTCTLRGALKKERTHHKNLVVVGDWVLFEETPDGEGVIVQVEPRTTVLSRADNLSRKKEQVIAANIDQVLIIASVGTPPLKTALIDRYIIAAKKGGMAPVVVINKIDLLNDEEQPLLNTVVASYEQAGIAVVAVSTKTGVGIDILKLHMQGKSSVFSGQSGVGKSSLINTVTGLTLPVGDMVKKTQKGTHTTTTAHLIRLDCGGFCVDTPGIKSFGMWNVSVDEIRDYYPDIAAAATGCRFYNCTHTHEEECSVRGAVERGEIASLRYDTYCNLIASLQDDHRRR